MHVLRGMTPEAGTIIGVHHRDQRFLTVGMVLPVDKRERRAPIRYATAAETGMGTLIGRVPRSVCEHEMIQKRQTPYGMARVIPTTAVQIELSLPSRTDVRREIKRVLRTHGLRSR